MAKPPLVSGSKPLSNLYFFSKLPSATEGLFYLIFSEPQSQSRRFFQDK